MSEQNNSRDHHSVEHVFQEKERVGKLSQIRELVFGAQDGLLVPLGVISSIAGAFNNNHIVIVVGISEALAGAFSMATGAYLASQAQRQVHKAEINKERMAIKKYTEDEKKELELVFQKEGLTKRDSVKVVTIIAKSPVSFFNTMVQKELGLEPEPPGNPLKDAILVGLSYILSAIIPLAPYFFFTGQTAIIISILLTLIALFGIGIMKGRVASLPYIKSGLQVLFVGAGSGIGGYFLGKLLPHVLGIK